jgi:hypothetical protein
MKKILFLLFALPMLGFGQQQTYVPDDAFEQALINLGYDNVLDDSVLTSNINVITSLLIPSFNGIVDMTGIEDFTALIVLECWYGNISNLDVSNNILLEKLDCRNNQLTSLNVSNNPLLKELWFSENMITNIDLSSNTDLTYLLALENQLSTLDVSANIKLEILGCNFNQLTTLDVSAAPYLESLGCASNLISVLDLRENINLTYVDCIFNNLNSLDIRNGNNFNLPHFQCYYNPNLACINVDDVQYSNMNWTKDSIANFSWDCDITSIEEQSQSKTLLKLADVLGRESKGTKNTPLFYLFDDGTVEKRIIIE